MMEVCFNTFNVQLEETPEEIRVQTEYALEINDDFISDCTIEIRVHAKDDI